MAKVMPFSMYYPSYHRRAGEPTYFVEKYYKSLYLMKAVPQELAHSFNFSIMNDLSIPAKHHTIRAGHRWKEGDMMSPRVWGTDINPKSGRSGPYHSKQIIIAPDTKVVKVYRFKTHNGQMYINGVVAPINNEILAANDGLEYEDFLSWFKFPKPFDGQIICWNEAAQYFV